MTWLAEADSCLVFLVLAHQALDQAPILIRSIRAQKPDVPIMVVIDGCDPDETLKVLQAGAADFLTKPPKQEDLFEALEAAKKQVAKGCRTEARLKSIKARFATLTPRENEVMRHVIAGRIHRETAKVLGTGVKMIKVHRGRVMKKLEVRSVADLVRLAEKAGVS